MSLIVIETETESGGIRTERINPAHVVRFWAMPAGAAIELITGKTVHAKVDAQRLERLIDNELDAAHDVRLRERTK